MRLAGEHTVKATTTVRTRAASGAQANATSDCIWLEDEVAQLAHVAHVFYRHVPRARCSLRPRFALVLLWVQSQRFASNRVDWVMELRS